MSLQSFNETMTRITKVCKENDRSFCLMNNENRGSPCILFAHSENSEVGKRLPELEPSNEKKTELVYVSNVPIYL